MANTNSKPAQRIVNRLVCSQRPYPMIELARETGVPAQLTRSICESLVREGRVVKVSRFVVRWNS